MRRIRKILPQESKSDNYYQFRQFTPLMKFFEHFVSPIVATFTRRQINNQNFEKMIKKPSKFEKKVVFHVPIKKI